MDELLHQHHFQRDWIPPAPTIESEWLYCYFICILDLNWETAETLLTDVVSERYLPFQIRRWLQQGEWSWCCSRESFLAAPNEEQLVRRIRMCEPRPWPFPSLPTLNISCGQKNVEFLVEQPTFPGTTTMFYADTYESGEWRYCVDQRILTKWEFYYALRTTCLETVVQWRNAGEE